MTNEQPSLTIADALPNAVRSKDWVLSLSRQEPSRLPPSPIRWAEHGQLRGFFYGLLFDREQLMASYCSGKPDCSDAELVLRAYERAGEAVLSRLRGSFVVAIVDSSRGLAIVAHDPLGSHPIFYAEVGSR